MTFLMNMIQNLIQASKQQEEYTPYMEVLQKITLTGKQYFNIGIQTSDNLTFECGFKLTSASNVSNGIFGGRHNTGRTQGSSTIWTGYEVRRVGSSTYTQIINRTRVGQVTTSQDIAINTFYDMVFLPTSLQLNNTSITLTQGTSIEQPMDIYLGAINNDGTATVPMQGDLTYFKIFDNGVLVSDCVPALNAQLEPCMYDRVRKILIKYSNISGETEAPSYTRWNKFDVDYIENTGTAYIPLPDIKPSKTIGMNIEYAYTATDTGSAGVIGTYHANTTASARQDCLFVTTSVGNTTTSNTNPIMVINCGSSIGSVNTTGQNFPPEANKWYNAKINWLNDDKLYWTDYTNEMEGDNGGNTPLTQELRLFSRYTTGTSSYGNCKARTRKLQFSDGSNIIRSYIPVVWHNSDTTAIATLYDEVYNKMETPSGSLKAYIANVSTTKTNVFTTTGATSGKAINAEGTIINSSASSYSALLPIVGGTVIECVSGNAGNNNYRYHCYDSSGNWIEQSLLLYAEGTGTVEPVTGSFTAPINAKYVRVSYATNASSTIQVKSVVETTYEVGSNCSATPDSVLGTSNCFDTGIYGNQDMQVKLISYLPSNVQATGQLFGSYDGSETTSQNLTINTTHTTGTAAPIRFNGKVITTPIKKGNTKVSIIDNKLGIWVDNALHGSWGNPNDFTTTTTLLVLKCNNSSNVRENGCCYLLIEENQTPIAEYIPVKNATVTTEYGLYDRVSGTLNTGVGTITFNALS